MKYKYIIGTGWWCTQNDTRLDKFLNGEDFIRSAEFHSLWAESIVKNTSPTSVVVIDSASPIKAKWDCTLLPYQIISLNKNAGHATNLKNDLFCGWTSSVLLSAEYASLCDCDYYVYVEQDALLHGEGIIEHCISTMGDAAYLFGRSDNNVQPLQQSFFIIRKDALNKFICRLRSIKYSDKDISPEVKFAVATSPLLFSLPHILYVQKSSLMGKVKRRIVTKLLKLFGKYSYLPVGYGRSRPIDFDDDYFYFQHGSAEELEKYNTVAEQK
ncbi:hypothetical protein [Alteromonas sp. 14N.309.X.WAT.G.H12]|uniref:hypothetical protein n=1 Tax=Alteromonas sp. 14N.309.X.WAT.G.H12 TaxID=3120824 RepID=UPI002FCE8751